LEFKLGLPGFVGSVADPYSPSLAQLA